jgi:Zn-dependent peptidase ImmA (M78 family)
MTRYERQAIEQFAGQVRAFTSAEIPIPEKFPAIIEKLRGQPVAYETFGGWDIAGKIEKKNASFLITLNAIQSNLRNNFTLAHELGHLFIHMGYMTDKKRWDSINEYQDSPLYRLGYSDEEYEANQFAGAFLMPEKEYLDFIKQNAVDNSIDIDFLASRFQVSRDAALTRGRWLGVFSWR